MYIEWSMCFHPLKQILCLIAAKAMRKASQKAKAASDP